MASNKLETGDIPAVRLLSIHPSKVKYTQKVGFFANALATIFCATLPELEKRIVKQFINISKRVSTIRNGCKSRMCHESIFHRNLNTRQLYLLFWLGQTTRIVQNFGEFGHSLELFFVSRSICVYRKGQLNAYARLGLD